VCTSEATRAHAASLGIPLLSDEGPWAIDVTVDGADEFDDALCLSKGGGGALTREKIVNAASTRVIIVCDATKHVGRIGETRPVAIEVLPFGHGMTARHLARFGQPRLRQHVAAPFRTDGGNFIIDLTIEPTSDPASLDLALRSIPGIVETGLFIDRTDVLYVAHADGRLERLTRPTRGGQSSSAGAG
jgi:ribose 5-phosphate isomerase A